MTRRPVASGLAAGPTPGQVERGAGELADEREVTCRMEHETKCTVARVRMRRNVKRVRPRRAKARGAALTETFFLTMILVPLLFGTAMLGKLIDIRQTAVQASRYTVWEATVHGDAAPPDDVHARFFARHGDGYAGGATDGGATAAASGDTGEMGMRAQTRVSFGPAGVAARDYEHERARGDDGGVAMTVGEAIHGAGNLLDGANGGEWNVSADGFVRGSVSVPVEGNGWLAGSTLIEPAVILNDGWSASGTAQLEKRTKSFVPAGALDTVGDVLSAVSVVPILKELKGLNGALGKVDAASLPDGERHVLAPYRETSP